MDTRCRCFRILIAVGLVLLLIGCSRPAGRGVFYPAWCGADYNRVLVAKSQYADVLCWAVVLVSVGIGAMIVLTWMGGVGGNSSLSKWWLMVLWPYPIGWVMGLVGGMRCPL